MEIAADRLKRKSWLSIAQSRSSVEKDKKIRQLIANVRELKAIDSGQLSTIRDSQSRVDMIGQLNGLVREHIEKQIKERVKEHKKDEEIRLGLAHIMAGQVIDTEESVSEKNEKLTPEQRQRLIEGILENLPQGMLSKMPSNKDGEIFKKNLDELLVKANLSKTRVVNMYQNIKEEGEQTPPSIHSRGLRDV